MIGDGINDGKFVIKKGGLSQAIASELGLNEQQVKQIGSIWSKIFAEVDKQQEQNLAEGKSAIYSGGKDLKGSVNENYKVFVGQAVEFSKEIWANIVKLVNDKLKTNIQVANSSANSTNEPKGTDVTTSENSVNNEQETDTSLQEADNNITMGDLEDFFKSIKKITPQGIAQDLIDEIFGGRANLDEIMPRINADNVLEVLDEYKKLSDEKNTKLGVKLDDETLIEAILDETISKEKKKEYINHIKNALIEKMNRVGGDTENLSKIFEKAINKVLNHPTGLQSSKTLDELVNTFIDTINKLKEMKDASWKYSISESYIEAVKIVLGKNGIDVSDIVGNGKFDNPAEQMTGNCWAHAGINAMMQTEAGRSYLNNLIIKNNITGAISIYLPGAEKQELPKPNGDGIYTYTEEEIAKRVLNTSRGDGDYTAFMLAIEDFRKEVTNDANATSESGSISNFCNLIFGTDDNIGHIRSKKGLIQAFEKGLPIFITFTNNLSLLGYDYDEGGHAVALKSIDINRGVAILIDSNYPNEPKEIDIETLVKHCVIMTMNVPSM